MSITRGDVLQNGEFYHVFNRGVDKAIIFRDNADRDRFVSSLARFHHNRVKIHAFCLMDNHYHLLLEQLNDGGISSLMKSLSLGYTMYFNKKYRRTDSLFGSRYQFTHVTTEAHFLHISRYIHLNPVEMIAAVFYREGTFDVRALTEFLRGYRWSSYSDYVGVSRYAAFIVTREILSNFESPQVYEQFTLDWLFSRLQSPTLKLDFEEEVGQVG